jgi:hypothetical protein
MSPASGTHRAPATNVIGARLPEEEEGEQSRQEKIEATVQSPLQNCSKSANLVCPSLVLSFKDSPGAASFKAFSDRASASSGASIQSLTASGVFSGLDQNMESDLRGKVLKLAGWRQIRRSRRNRRSGFESSNTELSSGEMAGGPFNPIPLPSADSDDDWGNRKMETTHNTNEKPPVNPTIVPSGIASVNTVCLQKECDDPWYHYIANNSFIAGESSYSKDQGPMAETIPVHETTIKRSNQTYNNGEGFLTVASPIKSISAHASRFENFQKSLIDLSRAAPLNNDVISVEEWIKANQGASEAVEEWIKMHQGASEAWPIEADAETTDLPTKSFSRALSHAAGLEDASICESASGTNKSIVKKTPCCLPHCELDPIISAGVKLKETLSKLDCGVDGCDSASGTTMAILKNTSCCLPHCELDPIILAGMKLKETLSTVDCGVNLTRKGSGSSPIGLCVSSRPKGRFARKRRNNPFGEIAERCKAQDDLTTVATDARDDRELNGGRSAMEGHPAAAAAVAKEEKIVKAADPTPIDSGYQEGYRKSRVVKQLGSGVETYNVLIQQRSKESMDLSANSSSSFSELTEDQKAIAGCNPSWFLE